MDKAPAAGGGPLLSLITINQQGGNAILGYVDKNKIRVLSEYVARTDVKAKFPADLEFRFGRSAIKEQT
ncbi:MAG: hypothetical protein ACKOCH_22410, partial [Bacteroidota bacterium]